MKTKVFVVLAACLLLQSNAHADSRQMLRGSDTMAGLMSDAIIAAGMNNVIGYAGGGSSTGEAAILNGEQGIASMSREVKPEAIAALGKKGSAFKAHVVALDGVGIFVNGANKFAGLTLDNIRDIFTCKVTSWEQVKGSSERGAIHAFRRNDQSGTTDTVKNLVGIKDFGACVTVVAETVDIAERTSNDPAAIGYAGLSAKRDKNLAVPVSKKDGSPFVTPNATTIRNMSYPLARKLFVYEVGGAAKPNAVEAQLLEKLLDRSFLDPIVQANEFYTID